VFDDGFLLSINVETLESYDKPTASPHFEAKKAESNQGAVNDCGHNLPLFGGIRDFSTYFANYTVFVVSRCLLHAQFRASPQMANK
jgi:hypothetical protein